VRAFFVEEALAAEGAKQLEFLIVAQFFRVRAKASGAGGAGYPKKFGHKSSSFASLRMTELQNTKSRPFVTAFLRMTATG
jgi:hypothetical protein